MSKQRKRDVVAATIAVLLVCLAMACLAGCKPKLEVGQVWQSNKSPDPFKNGPPGRRTVLALGDGHVQYEYEDGNYTYTGSMSEGAFRIRAFLAVAPAGISNEPVPAEPEETVENPNPIVIETVAPRMTITPAESHPVWGKGDLPADWQAMFGPGNGSRMNYVQSNMINQMATRIRTLEINQYSPDPNEIRNLKQRISELEQVE